MKVICFLSLIVIAMFCAHANATNMDSLQNPVPTPSKSTEKAEGNTTQYDKNAESHRRGAKELPAIIEISKLPLIQAETTDKTERHRDYSSSEWWLVYLNVALAIITCALAMYTAKLYRATVKLGKDAKTSGEAQAIKMEKSITEATRAATAMEQLANNSAQSVATVRERTAQQMRAYLTVIIGGATYQERDKNAKFAGRPRLVNTGHTPAYRVRYKAKAAILPIQLPDDFDFALPDQFIGASILGQQHFNELQGVVDDFVPDDEVVDIKHAKGRVLHIWGLVSYEDVFGEHHETRFCQTLTWIGEGEKEIIYGYYNSRHNDAT